MHADALLVAIGLQQSGRFAEAETIYGGLIADEGRGAQALYPYGLLLLGSGRCNEAAAVLARAAALRPDHEGVRMNLARAQLGARQMGAALGTAEAILAAAPANVEANVIRGSALSALCRPAEAIGAFERAIALEPGHAAAHLNLGNALVDLDRLAEAERYCRAAIRLDPSLVEAHASLGFILTSAGRLAEAIEACEVAIGLRPDFAEAHWNQATALLLAGDFRRGFRKYEWRKQHDRFRRDFIDLPGPVWQGEPARGRTILVHAEQGLGDTIQLARYLPLIAARGARPVLACDRRLVPLLGQLGAVVAKDQPLPGYDLWIDQMSLPRVFGTDPHTIPSVGGYLRADPERMRAVRAVLPEERAIGLVWAGNPAHSNDARRSLPVEQLERLLAVPGCRFVSLQVGPRSGEAGALAGVADLSSVLLDYAATAAVVAQLALVITVDTSVAHLAGALGKPCWVMLPFAPDWRWMLAHHEESPWYKSMRLFRQESPGEWGGVVSEVIEAIERWSLGSVHSAGEPIRAECC
jgi:tetratricopeptide (TPR) repeat protein